MPDFYGYEFDDPSIARGARQQGLTGMLLGMQQGRQDPNDWAGFLTGAATGFDRGYQGYLADYLPIYERQQKEAEAELERQRQEEAARQGVEWMRGQFGDFMGPDQGFGGPSAGDMAQSIPAATPPFVPDVPSESEFISGLNREPQGVRAPEFDYALPPSEIFASPAQEFEYLSGQLPQIQKAMAAREQATLEAQQEAAMLGRVNEALAGLGYSGPPIPDMDTGLAVLKQYAEPEPEMTPYQQAQVARWGRMDGENDSGQTMTPYQQFQSQRYLYEDALRRSEEEAEANADPLFENVIAPPGIELRGGVADERPMPEDFGLVLPANQAAPGPVAAPTGMSPAPRQRTVQPQEVKEQTAAEKKADNIIKFTRELPEADREDPELKSLVTDMVRDEVPPSEIRSFIMSIIRQRDGLGG